MKTKSLLLLILICLIINVFASGNKTTNSLYLEKPTGQYQVGVKDYRWVNQNICSSSLKDADKNDCNEIKVKIYYPTLDQSQSRTSYNQPFMKDKQQEISDHIPDISKEQINQLSQIKSYAIESAAIVKGDKFPVLILSPGGGCPAALYENFITELVSHGYIVVGINTQFTGETKNDTDIENKSVPYDIRVLTKVYEKIHALHHSDVIFSAMDFSHIGLFGHSIGGRVLADVAHTHPTWFQAAVTLDIGFDTSGASRKKFIIPVMHLVAASTKLERAAPITFELGKNNFLVVLSPTDHNHYYSRHMNFTDLSTLQYLPAFQKDLLYLKQETKDNFDIKFMPRTPTENEMNNFDKPTYVLIKKENKWDIEYFKIKTDKTHPKRGPYHFVGGTSSFKGLDASLAALTHKDIALLSDSDIKPIKEILISFQHNTLSEPFGTGNGWEITQAINTYLLQFFNTYLKHEENSKLNNCVALSKNTFIKCGIGTF